MGFLVPAFGVTESVFLAKTCAAFKSCVSMLSGELQTYFHWKTVYRLGVLAGLARVILNLQVPSGSRRDTGSDEG